MSKEVVYNHESLTETIKGFGDQMTGVAEELADICLKRKCKSISFWAGIFPDELPTMNVELVFANEKLSCPITLVTSLDEEMKK